MAVRPRPFPRWAAALLGAALLAAPLLACGGALSVQRLVFESGPRAAQPSLARDPQEGFVLTWQEPDAGGHALRFAVLDREGAERRRGLVSRGPDRFVNAADFPSLAVLDNGDWVTFWLQKTAAGTYAYEIRSVRSRDRGASWDAPVVVHRDGTPTEHGFVSMVAAGGDRVRLVWLDGRRMAADAHDGGEEAEEHMTLRTATLGRDGVLAGERELDSLTCACCQTDMVRAGDATLAAYRDRTEAEIRDIGAVVFAPHDAPRLAPVHADGWKMPGCPVNGPALAAHRGRVLAVWPTMADGPMAVRTAVGDAEGFGAPRTLGEGAAELGRLDAAAWRSGWLVGRVTTHERTPALTLAVLAADGSPHEERTVATPVGGYPRLAVDRGTALVAYTEPAGAGDSRIALLRVR